MPDAVEAQVLLNPAGLEAAADAEFVSRCFGTRWSVAAYRWYLQRPFAGLAVDRLILTFGNRAAAGCGLAYRVLRTPDGALHRVGVIVAAGTLPADRGYGCYARLLQAAVERGAARDCVALLGFVTATNATGRGLQRRGAICVPSAYIVTGRSGRVRGPSSLWIGCAAGFRRWQEDAATPGTGATGAGSVRFHYPDAYAWRAQYMDRPHGVEPIRIGRSTRALVETVGDTERLQWLESTPRERPAAIAALADRAVRAQRRFFMYSTLPADRATARRVGLRIVPGFLMALATETRHEAAVHHWATLPWQVQSGDRL